MTGRVPRHRGPQLPESERSDLRSTSHGLGPQANWVVNDNLVFSFSWIHDLTRTTACRRTTFTSIRSTEATGTTVRCRTSPAVVIGGSLWERKWALAATMLTMGLIMPTASRAGGLFLTEFGTEDEALAGAGWAARAQDASTLFKNPAGMSRLRRQPLPGRTPSPLFRRQFRSHGRHIRRRGRRQPGRRGSRSERLLCA